MRDRIKNMVDWLRKFGPVLRAIELGEMAWGLWDRIPGAARHLIGYGLTWFIVSVGWRYLLAAITIGQRNWPAAVGAGFVLATIAWAIIEGLRFRSARQALRPQVTEGTGEITIAEPVYVPEDHIKPSVTQEPVLPTPELFIEGSEFEFGEPGKRGYPESKIGAAWILRVSVYLKTTNGMQVECIELEVQGKRIPSTWESDAVYGVPSGMYIYFEIPPEITSGLHQAKLVALANGIWWRSLDYPITSPAEL